MNKYAVAVFNRFDETNKVEVVQAETSYDAVLVAVEGSLIDYYECNTVAELLDIYAEGDFIVSEPVVIENVENEERK